MTQLRPHHCVLAHSTSEANTQRWFCKDCSAQSRTANLSKSSIELSLSPSLPKSTLEANLLAPSLLAWVGEAKGHPETYSSLWCYTGPLWVPSTNSQVPPLFLGHSQTYQSPNYSPLHVIPGVFLLDLTSVGKPDLSLPGAFVHCSFCVFLALIRSPASVTRFALCSPPAFRKQALSVEGSVPYIISYSPFFTWRCNKDVVTTLSLWPQQ